MCDRVEGTRAYTCSSRLHSSMDRDDFWLDTCCFSSLSASKIDRLFCASASEKAMAIFSCSCCIVLCSDASCLHSCLARRDPQNALDRSLLFHIQLHTYSQLISKPVKAILITHMTGQAIERCGYRHRGREMRVTCRLESDQWKGAHHAHQDALQMFGSFMKILFESADFSDGDLSVCGL